MTLAAAAIVAKACVALAQARSLSGSVRVDGRERSYLVDSWVGFARCADKPSSTALDATKFIWAFFADH